MTQKKVAKEPSELELLGKKVEMLEGALKNVLVCAVTYLPSGAVLTATISGQGTVPELLATQKALQTIAVEMGDRAMAQLQAPKEKDE